jgi:hypothetical protein
MTEDKTLHVSRLVTLLISDLNANEEKMATDSLILARRLACIWQIDCGAGMQLAASNSKLAKFVRIH